MNGWGPLWIPNAGVSVAEVEYAERAVEGLNISSVPALARNWSSIQGEFIEDTVRRTGRRLAVGLTAAASILASGLTAMSATAGLGLVSFGIVADC